MVRPGQLVLYESHGRCGSGRHAPGAGTAEGGYGDGSGPKKEFNGHLAGDD